MLMFSWIPLAFFLIDTISANQANTQHSIGRFQEQTQEIAKELALQHHQLLSSSNKGSPSLSSGKLGGSFGASSSSFVNREPASLVHSLLSSQSNHQQAYRPYSNNGANGASNSNSSSSSSNSSGGNSHNSVNSASQSSSSASKWVAAAMAASSMSHSEASSKPTITSNNHSNSALVSSSSSSNGRGNHQSASASFSDTNLLSKGKSLSSSFAGPTTGRPTILALIDTSRSTPQPAYPTTNRPNVLTITVSDNHKQTTTSAAPKLILNPVVIVSEKQEALTSTTKAPVAQLVLASPIRNSTGAQTIQLFNNGTPLSLNAILSSQNATSTTVKPLVLASISPLASLVLQGMSHTSAAPLVFATTKPPLAPVAAASAVVATETTSVPLAAATVAVPPTALPAIVPVIPAPPTQPPELGGATTAVAAAAAASVDVPAPSTAPAISSASASAVGATAAAAVAGQPAESGATIPATIAPVSAAAATSASGPSDAATASAALAPTVAASAAAAAPPSVAAASVTPEGSGPAEAAATSVAAGSGAAAASSSAASSSAAAAVADSVPVAAPVVPPVESGPATSASASASAASTAANPAPVATSAAAAATAATTATGAAAQAATPEVVKSNLAVSNGPDGVATSAAGGTVASAASSATASAAQLAATPPKINVLEPAALKNVDKALEIIAQPSSTKDGLLTVSSGQTNSSTTIIISGTASTPTTTSTTTTTTQAPVAKNIINLIEVKNGDSPSDSDKSSGSGVAIVKIDASKEQNIKIVTSSAAASTAKPKSSTTTSKAKISSITIDSHQSAKRMKNNKSKSTKKPKKSHDDELLKLGDKYGAGSVHDVIVVGEHEEGDDLNHDYDDHSEHHGESDSDDSEHHGSHHQEGKAHLTLDHSSGSSGHSKGAKKTNSKQNRLSESGSSSASVTLVNLGQASPAQTVASMVSELASGLSSSSSSYESEHSDHEHLIEGLMVGDVIHVDAAPTTTTPTPQPQSHSRASGQKQGNGSASSGKLANYRAQHVLLKQRKNPGSHKLVGPAARGLARTKSQHGHGSPSSGHSRPPGPQVLRHKSSPATSTARAAGEKSTPAKLAGPGSKVNATSDAKVKKTKKVVRLVKRKRRPTKAAKPVSATGNSTEETRSLNPTPQVQSVPIPTQRPTKGYSSIVSSPPVAMAAASGVAAGAVSGSIAAKGISAKPIVQATVQAPALDTSSATSASASASARSNVTTQTSPPQASGYNNQQQAQSSSVLAASHSNASRPTTREPMTLSVTTSQPASVRLNAKNGPKTMSVVRDLTFSSAKGGIIHTADANGIVSHSPMTTTSQFNPSVTPPPLTKGVIEWISKQRLVRGDENIGIQNELQARRDELMHERQINAARQMRLAHRLGGSLMRSQLDGDLNERLLESELRRYDDLRGQLRNRLDKMNNQRAFYRWGQ